MKKRFFALLVLSFALFATISAAIGDWEIYNSYRNATTCRSVGDKVYVLSAGSLYSFNKEDNELRLYDHINTLSDVRISFIEYSDVADALVILYDNANVDLLYEDDAVYNISDFKNKALTGKRLNNLQVINSLAYISTEFGVVTLNLKRQEFSNTYNLGFSVDAVAVYDGYIFACTPTGLYRGSLSANLLDKSNWSHLFKYPITALQEYQGTLFGILPGYGFYSIDVNGRFKQLLPNEGTLRFTSLSVGESKMLLGTNSSKVYIYDSPDNYIVCSTNALSLCEDGNSFWACNGSNGLSRLAIKDGKLVETLAAVLPDSPARNYCEYLAFSPSGSLLVAGGNLNYFDDTFYPGTIMAYDGDKWTNFPEQEVKNVTGLNYQNITSVVENPKEPGHYFASSFGYGLYEFRDGEFVKHYNHTNSPLKSVISSGYVERYVRVPRLSYDASGNLWMTNTGTQEIIKILKNDGTWQSLSYNEIKKKPTMVEILFDSRGWLWVTSLQAGAGLFCAKMNGTPFDISDDETKFISDHLKNQDGISYDINQLCALVEDRNGQMWLGTDKGLFVLQNPKKFFDGNVTFTQIKVPRNDGTGLADYLLSGIFIQAMCVDGANRKWVGTKDNGIYLISADGLETIHHFTSENSSLPSNSIASIAVEDATGKVFIGTDKGLVSYTSDATAPSPVLKESALHAYPNPVREGYTGTICVTGFTEDCNVKIVDASGTLIYETTSIGGQITWNGCDMRGDRVSAGVYYVLAYDAVGDEGAATKILVIR